MNIVQTALGQRKSDLETPEMLSSSNKATVLCWKSPGISEMRAGRIAEFLGAEARIVAMAAVSDRESVSGLALPGAAVIVHADTLVRVSETLDRGVEALLALVGCARYVFVYGFKPIHHHTSILRTLSFGSLLGVQPLPASETAFRVSKSHRELCGPFSGLSVQGVDPSRDGSFIESLSRAGQDALIRASERPFLVRVNHGDSELFFVACNEFPDLDEEVSSEAGLLPWFSRLVPLMIFLRRAFGKRLWHPDCSRASFIIDDPLLRRKYGFLEYSKLLETMEEHKFSTSIAFIPWNYRRSHKYVADLFSAEPTALSLCVHGCDHTGAEFAETSVGFLRDKARLALERMRAHSELYGLPFDEVMVFPQGLFSSAALQALDACGYLAAVNTSLCPSHAPRCLTLEDLLSVAVTRFGGVPVFGRRYPRDVAEFAFDLFVGKPALVVEHHGYFRNGYSEIETFARRLNELDAHLEWSSLATICSRACLKRFVADGTVHVRMYTNRFQFSNNGHQSTTYVFSLPWAPDKPLPQVALNGSKWVRDSSHDRLTTTLSLDPGQTVDIRISPPPLSGTSPYRKPVNRGNAKVLIRRILSEFRDDHVDTNPVLAGLVSGVRGLRASGRVLPWWQSPAESATEPRR